MDILSDGPDISLQKSQACPFRLSIKISLTRIITCLFSFQMPFSAISNVCDFLCISFSFLFPLRVLTPHLPLFSIYGHISYLFDKMASLFFCHFDLVFKCPLLPLFISRLNSFPFHEVYYFLTTLRFPLTFSLLVLFFSKGTLTYSPLGSGVPAEVIERH